MLREKFVTKKQFEVFSRNLDRKLASLKVPSFTAPDDNYDPDDVPGAGLPAGGVDYQVLYTDSAGAAQWAMPGDRNVFIGEEAAKDVTVANRNDNVYIGYLAGWGDVAEEFVGNQNVIIGSYYDVGTGDTHIFGDGSNNVFIGWLAGALANDPMNNVVIGSGIVLTPGGTDYALTKSVLLGADIGTDVHLDDIENSIGIGYGVGIIDSNTCYIGNDDLELIVTQADIQTYGVYYCGTDQIMGARVIDGDFANVPDTGDIDTDDLIAAIVTALTTHGLIASA